MPLNAYYQENILSLQRYHPDTWTAISSLHPSSLGEICTDPGGRPNLQIITDSGEKVLIHKQDDEQQALQQVPQDSTGTVVLFGMGLGYEAVAICKQRPDIRHIVIFELHPGIFAQALHCQDLTPLLSDPRIILSIGPEPDLSKIFAPTQLTMKLEHTYILNRRTSALLDQQTHQEVFDRTHKFINDYCIIGNTALKYGRRYLHNTFTHLKSIHHNLLLENYRDALKDIPAILVAAGPSLNKNIATLKEAKGNAVIFSVDAALPALLKHDIIPDIVGSVDPLEISYEKIADTTSQTKNSFVLTCLPSIAPTTPKTFPAKQILWGFTDNSLESCIGHHLGAKKTFLGVGTVAHWNFLVASFLGCSPIILIGQDLSFPKEEGQDHATGVVLASNYDLNKHNETKGEIFWINGTLGGKVPTDRPFLFLLRNFEFLLENHPGHHINATEGGANIKGTEILPLAKAIALYCKKPKGKIGDILTRFSRPGPADASRTITWLSDTINDIHRIQKTIKKTDQLTIAASTEISRLKKTGKPYYSFPELPAALQDLINKIDKGQEQSDHPQEIWSILTEITKEGLKESERLKHIIIKLHKSPEKYLEYKLKNLERILQTNRARLSAIAILEEEVDKTLQHLKKEKKLIEALTGTENKDLHELNLARFYFNSGELVFATPLLEKVYTRQPESAEVNFYLGCIAAEHAEHEKSAAYFRQAIQMDPEFSNKIEGYRQQLGDRYFEFWQFRYHPQMLTKGNLYCPGHPKISAALALNEINTAHKTNTPETTDNLILTWHDKLEKDKEFTNSLTAEQAAEFHAHHGQLMMSENQFQAAVRSFAKALEYTPANPDYHILQTEALFAANNFDIGIEHLKKAIAINPQYAKHWEEIGDQLHQLEQHQDAIAAYEQCLHSLPEHISLLRKIGACYEAMNNQEAALSVYKILKGKIEQQG